MSAKPTYKPGDIYLVRMHPAYGTELKKFRPCLVLATPPDARFCTIIPFTTAAKKLSPQEIKINPTPTNGLQSTSLALTWYLLTIDTHRLEQRLGILDKSDRIKIHQSISQIIKIEP